MLCHFGKDATYSTVESHISGMQNSGKPRISGQFLNDQLFIKIVLVDIFFPSNHSFLS